MTLFRFVFVGVLQHLLFVQHKCRENMRLSKIVKIHQQSRDFFVVNTNGCFGMWGNALLCSVGGPVLFIHDKCVLLAWAAPNRLNMSWKWFSSNSWEVPVESRLKSRHVSPCISWAVVKLKAILVRFLFTCCPSLQNHTVAVIFACSIFPQAGNYLVQLRIICWDGWKGYLGFPYKTLSICSFSSNMAVGNTVGWERDPSLQFWLCLPPSFLLVS